MSLIPNQTSAEGSSADVTDAALTEIAGAEATATAKPKPKKNLKTSVFLTVTSQYPLVEPFTHQTFRPGVQTETSEVTPWLQMQIDAGLMIQS